MMRKMPKRGMPKAFTGIRPSGRGKGHQRPWTAVSSFGFLSVIFLVSSSSHGGLANAKPVQQIFRLNADQMQEILAYIHAQEKEEKGGKENGGEIKKIDVKKKTKETEESARMALALLKEANDDDAQHKMEKIPDEDKWREINLSSPKEKLDSAEFGNQRECKPEEEHQLQTRIRHFLHSQLQHIWSDQFMVQVLGLNVTIHSIRARRIRPPHVKIQPSNCLPSSSSPWAASISGGSLSIWANYRSVYRTVRVGTLSIHLSKFHGNLDSLKGHGGLCATDANVGHLNVRFRPRLLDEVDETVTKWLKERVQHLICRRLPVFLLGQLR